MDVTISRHVIKTFKPSSIVFTESLFIHGGREYSHRWVKRETGVERDLRLKFYRNM